MTSAICGEQKDKETETHVGLEAEIDVWIMHQRGKDIRAYDVYRDLRVNKKDAGKLAAMYHAMFRDVLHLDISEKRFYETIQEIPMWTALLYPRRSVYLAIRTIEVALGNHAFSNMMLVDKYDEMIINNDHLTYTLPWLPHETICASFPQLYGKAFTKAAKLMKGHERSDFTLDFNGIPSQLQNIPD